MMHVRGAALLQIVGSAVLYACGSSDAAQPPPAPVDPHLYQVPMVRASERPKTAFESERERLDAISRAFLAGDTQSMEALIDPDADSSFSGMNDASDRGGLMKAYGRLFGAFSGRTYVPARIWQRGQVAIVEWVMLGVHAAEWMDVRSAFVMGRRSYPGLAAGW
jgi:hypothetical protein